MSSASPLLVLPTCRKYLTFPTGAATIVVMDDAELNREFGSRLRLMRRQAHLSQDALAESATLSRTSVVNIERGRQGVSLATLYRLAGALACDCADLLPKPANTSPPVQITVGGNDRSSQQAVSRILSRLEAENQQ